MKNFVLLVLLVISSSTFPMGMLLMDSEPVRKVVPRYPEPPDPKTINIDRDVQLLPNGAVIIRHPPRCTAYIDQHTNEKFYICK